MLDSSTWRNPRLSGRIRELDGVRGLALLLIVVFHYYVQSSYFEKPWMNRVLLPFHLMISGVDLFFVLPGFLIGGILYDARFSKNYYSTFYLRRAHRILPVYLFWLLLFWMGIHAVSADNSSYLHNLFNRDVLFWLYPLFLQNIFTGIHHQWGAEWVSATPSFAVEEQFYLLLPFGIRVLRVGGIPAMTVAAIVLAPLVRVALVRAGNDTHGPYTLLPCRADALGLGVLLAPVCRNQRAWTWLENHRGWIHSAFVLLALGVVGLACYPTPRFISTVGYSWLAFFCGCLMLLVLVKPSRMLRTVFRSSSLVLLGTYSYAIYVFRYGIFGLCHYGFFRQVPSVHNWVTFWVTNLAFVITLGCAVISWRWMELPLIRRASARYCYREASE
jgi:peptidoglycan/LPS O-acetylase OafA/YrhL